MQQEFFRKCCVWYSDENFFWKQEWGETAQYLQCFSWLDFRFLFYHDETGLYRNHLLAAWSSFPCGRKAVHNSWANITELLVLELVHIWSALNVNNAFSSVLERLCRHVHAVSGKRRCVLYCLREDTSWHTFNFMLRDTYLCFKKSQFI